MMQRCADGIPPRAPSGSDDAVATAPVLVGAASEAAVESAAERSVLLDAGRSSPESCESRLRPNMMVKMFPPKRGEMETKP